MVQNYAESIPTLLKTFNWIMDNKPPPPWREAMISVIPKEGKDKLLCASYRPVSLLNNDYKLLTSILTKRIEQILPVYQYTKIKHKDLLDKDRPKTMSGKHCM